jgi:hypothetical protein
MTLIFVLLKASIVLSVVIVAQALLGRRASAATRHLMWALAIVGLLVLPMLSLALPGWAVIKLPAATGQAAPLFAPLPESHLAVFATRSAEASAPIAATAGAAPRAAGGAGISWVMAILVLYAIGLVVLLVRLAGERCAIHRLARRATPVCDPEWLCLLHECSARIGVAEP